MRVLFNAKRSIESYSAFATGRNFLSACLLMLISSCEDFVKLDAPKTELVRSTVFDSDLTAQAATASLYVGLSTTSGTLNSITALGAFSSDEFDIYINSTDYIQFFDNNVVPTNGLISNLWRTSYSIIYRANSIIEGVQKSDKLTPALKTQLEGEAKFIRAFVHFYLLNLFGDVPFISSTDYQVNNVVSRLPENAVYEAIVSDLMEAKVLLPESYRMSERIIPNRWAAAALLARTYLYKEDWQKAADEAKSIIDNGSTYELVQPDEVFLKNSLEAIWQLFPALPNRNTNDGDLFILNSPPTFSALRDELVDTMEQGDLRKEHWVGSYTDGENTWYFPHKYKIKNGSNPLNEYAMVLRLGEQYLIRAEALARLNNIEDAIIAVDRIRERAGLPSVTTMHPEIGQADLLAVIEQERRVEFFSEWAHRWLDLKRTNRADIILASIKPDWESTDILYPIPEAEVLINVNLNPQNPGY